MQKQVTGRAGMTVDVRVICDRNATVAEAAMLGEIDGSATGSAKREQGDLYDRDIAMDLAVGRALVKLGLQLQRRGEKAVSFAARFQSAVREAEAFLSAIPPERDGFATGKALLPLDVIASTYGTEAAARAATRRGERFEQSKEG